MISVRRNRKPLLLGNVRINVIGDEKRLVVMNLETMDHKTVTVGMLPETAFSMLEDLSISTLGITKGSKKDQEIMYR